MTMQGYILATPLTLKIIFSENDIYGAQAIGYKGVDKRIDIISTAIKGNLKVWDLKCPVMKPHCTIPFYRTSENKEI